MRFDEVKIDAGVELSGEIELTLPWSTEGKALGLWGAIGEFLPAQGPERLAMAIDFIAGVFAGSMDVAANAFPELTEVFHAAADEPAFRAACARSEALWARRHLRGEIDPRVSPAKVIFAGKSLLTLEAEGARLSFKLDTSRLVAGAPLQVSNWCLNAAKVPIALRLESGGHVFDFDHRGELV